MAVVEVAPAVVVEGACPEKEEPDQAAPGTRQETPVLK
jgi:hypothetical protein